MKTPLHLWVVAVLSILWNAGGAYDYVMTQFRNIAYLEMLTPEQLLYIVNAPAWFDAAWATGVWASVVGSVLLLARSRLAVAAFAVSLAGLAVSSIYSFVIAQPNSIAISGSFAIVFTGVVVVVLVALWGYARAMARRGVLR